MDKITNYNCDKICSEITCNKVYTHFTIIKINDLELHIALCNKHSKIYEKNQTMKGGYENENLNN